MFALLGLHRFGIHEQALLSVVAVADVELVDVFGRQALLVVDLRPDHLHVRDTRRNRIAAHLHFLEQLIAARDLLESSLCVLGLGLHPARDFGVLQVFEIAVRIRHGDAEEGFGDVAHRRGRRLCLRSSGHGGGGDERANEQAAWLADERHEGLRTGFATCGSMPSDRGRVTEPRYTPRRTDEMPPVATDCTQ